MKLTVEILRVRLKDSEYNNCPNHSRKCSSNSVNK